MEIFTRKGPGRPRKAVADVVPVAEAPIDVADDAGHGQVSNGGLGTQAESRRARERREISVLTRMMTGASFIVRK